MVDDGVGLWSSVLGDGGVTIIVGVVVAKLLVGCFVIVWLFFALLLLTYGNDLRFGVGWFVFLMRMVGTGDEGIWMSIISSSLTVYTKWYCDI